MGSIALDHPGELSWFPDYPPAERRRRPVGDCPHACEHRSLKVVAWGPDLEHYELSICQDDGCVAVGGVLVERDEGCRGNCRGWHGPSSYERLKTMDWKLLEAPDG